MNESAAVDPRTSSNTNQCENGNHCSCRRRRPVVLPSRLASVLIVTAMKISLCFLGGRVTAHRIDTYTQTKASSNNDDQRGGRSYRHHSRVLCDCLRSRFSLVEECYKLSKPCNCIVDGICGIRGGVISEYDNHNVDNHRKNLRERRRRLWHRTRTLSFPPKSRFNHIERSKENGFVKQNSSSYGENRGHGHSIQHDFHHNREQKQQRQLASSKQRCLDAILTCQGAVSRSSRLLPASRFNEKFFRIERGGANRFVKDDDGSNNNKDETFGVGAYDKRKGVQRDKNKSASKGLRKHSPVVYQHFGRSRGRGGQSYQSQADDAPLNFILLGPNVDHWKTVGQTLASKGFNVMACERMVGSQQRKNSGNDGDGNADYECATNYEDAPELVLEILDALKWDKAVLVGCDDESSLAMETAMMLAPDRVAGLILCGDLTAANQFAKEAGGVRVLQSFLHRVLDCPFVIAWDGGDRSIASGSSVHEAIETKSSPFDDDGVDGRCVILGGGSAPHRTKPEYFAWVLARFVEEKIEHHSTDFVGSMQRSAVSEASMEENNHIKARQNRGGILQNLNLPFGIDSLVSPEGRLLLGRAVAAAIFYTSVMKVVFVQYGIIRMGWISIKNSVDSVDALRRKIFQVTGAFVWNFGYIPRLFKFSLKRTKELDEDEIDSSNIKIVPEESPEEKKTDGNSSDSLSTSFDEDDTDDARKEDEDEDNEDTLRIKPLFFLDNIFT